MNILFTGARSGLAKATIDRIVKDNYKIYVTVRTDEQLKSIKNRYKNFKNVECLKLDITNKTDREKILKLDIDILFCNAAISYGGSISEISFDLVRENYEVNVFGTFELIQLALKNMIKKDSGKIIIMGSLAGTIPLNFMGVYCSTKASINMLSTTLKNELKLITNNISIKLIEPGLYYTGFNQLMAENKYDWMVEKSYFKNIIPKIQAKERLMFNILEKQKLDSIVDEMVNAIKDNNDKFIYNAPTSQVIGTKIYSLFKK